MRAKILVAVSLVAFIATGPANATMPMLMEMPAERTVETCSQWALRQDEETISMWGVKEAGGADDMLGRHRLTSSCLREPVSDIVGFGSSVGFDATYCEGHTDAPICKR